MNIKKYLLTIIKYALTLLVIGSAFITFPSKKYLMIWLLELGLIAAITNLIMVEKNSTKHARSRRIFGRIFNDLGILMLLAQVIVMKFARTYILLVMLTNLDSAEDLAGNKVPYIIAIVVIVAAVLLPAEYIKLPEKKEISSEVRTRFFSYRLIAVFMAMSVLLIYVYGTAISPFYAYIDLVAQKKQQAELAKQNDPSVNITADFYNEGIGDGVIKPDSLSDNPNIIIILTEGVSENIIEDDRNVMPNMKALQEKSIYFDNYYNHTFATYRAIIGQLYSGYQENNYDENKLTSIMSILSERGYHTTYINTEPENQEFVSYVNNLGFDEVITGEPDKESYVDNISDEDAYKLLYDRIEEESASDTPYLIVMYTFCTHTSFDSWDQMYGDGSVPYYNKFYNVDYHFGKFFDKWSDSELADDTVFVMTTDHAPFADGEYASAFPEHYAERNAAIVDEMPLMIWHKGVEPTVYDAEGRNSLDMVPTVLDYVDIDSENYFLGSTLFERYETEFDTTFHSDGFLFTTYGGNVSTISDNYKDEVLSSIFRYFTAKLQEPEKP